MDGKTVNHSVNNSIAVEKAVALDFDLGLLAAFDPNAVDDEAYRDDPESYLQSHTRDGVQLLINELFSLPTKVDDDGVMAQLPPVKTHLPREKPLPSAKLLTKWQKFAASKGIAPKKRREKLVYDEEKQDWVPRWGFKGKNKALDEQWLVEVPAGKDADYDPVLAARKELKARKLKNESQRLKNESRATAAAARASTSSSANQSLPLPALGKELAGLERSFGKFGKRSKAGDGPASTVAPEARAGRRAELEAALHATRKSTASLGRFDDVLEGDPKQRGIKRKFQPNEVAAHQERDSNLSILKKLDREPQTKKSKKDDLVNVRKAIKEVSKGRGSLAIGVDGKKKGGKGKR